ASVSTHAARKDAVDKKAPKAAPEKSRRDANSELRSQHAHAALQGRKALHEVYETGMPKELKAAADALADGASVTAMTSFIDVAGKNGISPESIVDALVSGKGPMADAV